MKPFKKLREKYPKFIYEGYCYKVVRNNLKVFFDFRVEPDLRFKPVLIVKNINRSRIKKIKKEVLDNLVFHLGLIEIPSYWKATCSPEIAIESGFLNKEQLRWWKDLIIKGMGQFFYENKIDWRLPNFLKIKTIKTKSNQSRKSAIAEFYDWYLVPVGGGKDSVVTLEKLKKTGKKINAFTVNPGKAVKDVLRTAGIKNPIVVERKIDPALLKLNKRGYLNGHTPFTAVLSFLSVFCAVLFSYKNIAFSNEKSADEGNVRYLGKMINHQYSKSSDFEKKFQKYCKKYLVKNIRYFSFLRKYTELEIAEMFSNYPKYFPVFSSCNKVAAKKLKKRWCGKCPKCLFIYLTLCPYLKKKQLLKIFGEDLLRKKELRPILKSLIGQGRVKPFECVGTYAEAKKALKLCLKNSKIKK
ncbi:MAG: hypothetical protein DRZ76_01660 [Candidatus Nealsonbacteria bacterium]|nr:MAG: hypothetical protein DRZ76_01660 [Candidatus Nealsonbacteria bacterium]